jgi:septal ring factor EnvC (AmiA/AmiB activator)
MDKEILIEVLTEENTTLKTKLALHFMDATDEDKQLAEQLFNEQRDLIAVLNVEVASIAKSRDQFQAENRRLKRRIATLEGKC